MDKRAVFEHYSKLIDKALDNNMFLCYFLQSPYFIEDIRINTCIPHFVMNYGASRGCFIDHSYDYVVKFDIEGDDFFDSLCERELEIYKTAKAVNLDKGLVEAEYLGVYHRDIEFFDQEEIDQIVDYPEELMCEDGTIFDWDEAHTISINLPLYGYRYATCIERVYQNEGVSKDEWCDRVVSFTHSGSPLAGRNTQIAARFSFDYGMDYFKKFSKLLDEYEVNDLHVGNIGYIDDRIVLIDYSGYKIS